ncbi:unnamed protein product [Calypogeia fissa]
MRSNVVSIIKDWSKERGIDHLPLAALGHSNGANFSSQLTLELGLKSLVLMCAPGEFEVLEHADASVFPFTLYVDMTIDNGPEGFYPQVVRALKILRARGVETGQIHEWPRPIGPSNFTDKIPRLRSATAKRRGMRQARGAGTEGGLRLSFLFE